MSESRDDNTLVGIEMAPSLLVDGYRGALMRGGVVRLNFFANRVDPGSGATVKAAVATLCMPALDFYEVVDGLVALREQLIAAGVRAPEASP
jgi:hypothetical protein